MANQNTSETFFVGSDQTYEKLCSFISEGGVYTLKRINSFDALIDELMEYGQSLCICEEEHDDVQFNQFKLDIEIYQFETNFILLTTGDNRSEEKRVSTLNLSVLNKDYFNDVMKLHIQLHNTNIELKEKKVELGKMMIEQKERDVIFLNLQSSMLSLVKLKLISFDQSYTLQKMTEIISTTLGVERIGIYFLDISKHSLFCEEEFHFQSFTHQKGRTFNREDYPGKLDESFPWPLVSNDTQKDAKINNFYEVYLRKNNVGALMVIPIYFKGVLYGSIQIENLNSAREWKIDEQNFAQAVSEFIVLTIEAEQLKKEDIRIKEREKAYQLELVKRNNELQEFTSVVSHDLQEPLYKINAFGELLDERIGSDIDEKSNFYIERMRGAAKRMSRLIKDLLMYSKTSSEGREFLQVNLKKLVKDVLIDLEYRIEEKKAEIEVCKLDSIDADIIQMQQLFQNIISNSLKFHKPDEVPKIKISGKKLGKSNYQIIISDDGIGFDEKDAPKIFQVFKRLPNGKEFEGTGIGLAVCQKIIERHKGNIEVNSQINKGVEFTITLPINQRNTKKSLK